jgi:hypothetical protein
MGLPLFFKFFSELEGLIYRSNQPVISRGGGMSDTLEPPPVSAPVTAEAPVGWRGTQTTQRSPVTPPTWKKGHSEAE